MSQYQNTYGNFRMGALIFVLKFLIFMYFGMQISMIFVWNDLECTISMNESNSYYVLYEIKQLNIFLAQSNDTFSAFRVFLIFFLDRGSFYFCNAGHCCWDS